VLKFTNEQNLIKVFYQLQQTQANPIWLCKVMEIWFSLTASVVLTGQATLEDIKATWHYSMTEICWFIILEDHPFIG
jgi:hypothetical protein